MTIQHVVLFSFPEEPAPETYDEMRAMIAEWPGAIGHMRRLRFGADVTGSRTRGYSRLLFMEFDSTEELHAYQQHPVHQRFHRWVVDHECTPLAFDYALDDHTLLMPERDEPHTIAVTEKEENHGRQPRG